MTKKTELLSRKPGFYRVRINSGWTIAEWRWQMWGMTFIPGIIRDYDLLEIDENMIDPDKPIQNVPEEPKYTMGKCSTDNDVIY